MTVTGRPRLPRPPGASPSPAAPPMLRVDHTHTPHQRRVARAVREVIGRILQPNEKVLDFTEAIELGGLLDRTAHGCWWAPARRVAIVFTGQRLVEIVLGSLGRRARGRVRSFPWDRMRGLHVRGRWLEVETWAEVRFRWYLRERPDGELGRALHTQVDLAVSTFRPSDSSGVPLEHCGRCGAVRPSAEGPCRHCAAEARSRRLAAWLAVGVPGGGHLYAGRVGAAVAHLALEVGAFAVTTVAVLTAHTFLRGLVAMATGVVSLAFLKAQAALSARLLAARAGPVPAAVQRRWRLLAAVAPLLAAAILALPLVWVGAADPGISYDLVFLTSRQRWTGRTLHAAGGSAARRPGERSRWLSSDGLLVRVDAQPLAPFETAERARARLRADLGPGAEEVTIDPSGTLLSIRRAGASAEVRLAVVDPVGRDVHFLVARVPRGDVAAAREEMEGLLRRGIWIPAGTPLRPPPDG